MPSLDAFDADAFTLQSMTAAINRIPEVPTLLGSLNVFDEEGVSTTDVSVERRDEKLTLVARSARGGPGETVGGETREAKKIVIPHFQRDDSVIADEVQNVRAFGSESTLEALEQRVQLKLARHARSFDFTLEFMRLGAINGVVIDKNGVTILDLFSAFGVAVPTAVDFLLGTATTDIRGKCRQVLDAVEDALEGQMVSRVYGLAGDDFFHKFVEHDKVKATYTNWEAAVNLRADPRRPFEFGGISWVRYHTKPKAKKARSPEAPLIANSDAKFVAAGVPDLYITRFAPADWEETVNTLGLPRYARQYAMQNGKGRNLEMQMNGICMCTVPEAIQRATTSN